MNQTEELIQDLLDIIGVFCKHLNQRIAEPPSSGGWVRTGNTAYRPPAGTPRQIRRILGGLTPEGTPEASEDDGEAQNTPNGSSCPSCEARKEGIAKATAEGRGGQIWTEERRQRQSELMRGNRIAAGEPHPTGGGSLPGHGEGTPKTCSRCGFVGANSITCESVIDVDGQVLERKHRPTLDITEGRDLSIPVFGSYVRGPTN